MRTLIVLLPPQPPHGAQGAPEVSRAPELAAEYDYVLSADGLNVDAHASAGAALLPRPDGAGAETVAVVPFASLSWHQVELPKGITSASPRLRAVLEGLLEDQLLEEPETLHFALQPLARANTPVWVAVCNRAWLRSHVQALQAAGRPVSRIVPELSPGDPAALHVLGDPDCAMVVLADAQGVAVWPLAASALPALPADIHVLAEPAVAGLAEQALQRKVSLMQAPQRHLQALQSPWDLAQLELASTGRTRALKKLGTRWAEWRHAPQWRPARWGLAVLVLSQLVGLNTWAWKEHRALAAKQLAIRSALTTTFPKLKVIVDAPLQMAREVAALRQATGAPSGRDLESMLSAFSAVAPEGTALTAIEYIANELRLKASKLQPAELQAVTAGLQSRGYTLRSEGDNLIIRQETSP